MVELVSLLANEHLTLMFMPDRVQWDGSAGYSGEGMSHIQI